MWTSRVAAVTGLVHVPQRSRVRGYITKAGGGSWGSRIFYKLSLKQLLFFHVFLRIWNYQSFPFLPSGETKRGHSGFTFFLIS